MAKTSLVAATAFGMVLAAGAASAGPCSSEIEALQKQISSAEAGMGPTGSGDAVQGTVAETGELHPPTGTMGEATEGKAASPDDMTGQNQDQRTDSEAAQAGEFGTSAAPIEAEAALERARQFDLAGDEAACMAEIGKVKAELGIE